MASEFGLVAGMIVRAHLLERARVLGEQRRDFGERGAAAGALARWRRQRFQRSARRRSARRSARTTARVWRMTMIVRKSMVSVAGGGGGDGGGGGGGGGRRAMDLP